MQKMGVFLLLLVLFGCKNTGKRAHLKLPREQFMAVLTDLHLYEGSLGPKNFADDSISVDQQNHYDSIFHSYGIEQADFAQEYEQYVRYYPKDLDSIYTEIIQQVNVEVDSLRAIDTAPLNQKKLKLNDEISTINQ